MEEFQSVVLVDKQDHVVGLSEKYLAHQQALLHRAFSVFIFRKKSKHLELLLQRRQWDKYHSMGLWTNTCCGHPNRNENIILAGQRRLKEEMGIEVNLMKVGRFHYKVPLDNNMIENEIDYVLIGFFKEQPIQPNEQEVSDFCWIRVQDLLKDLRKRPEIYTRWLQEALRLSLNWKKIKR